MDRRWKDSAEWARLNPQPVGYDEDESARPQSISTQALRILEHVEQYRIVIEGVYVGNDVVEVDENSEEKTKTFIKHSKKTYISGLVLWPRWFPEVKKAIRILVRNRRNQ
jgi:hypothetical protein